MLSTSQSPVVTTTASPPHTSHYGPADSSIGLYSPHSTHLPQSSTASSAPAFHSSNSALSTPSGGSGSFRSLRLSSASRVAGVRAGVREAEAGVGARRTVSSAAAGPAVRKSEAGATHGGIVHAACSSSYPVRPSSHSQNQLSLSYPHQPAQETFSAHQSLHEQQTLHDTPQPSPQYVPPKSSSIISPLSHPDRREMNYPSPIPPRFSASQAVPSTSSASRSSSYHQSTPKYNESRPCSTPLSPSKRRIAGSVPPGPRTTSPDPNHHESSMQNSMSRAQSLACDPQSPSKRARPDCAPKILPLRYETIDVEDLVMLISHMLGELIATNDPLALTSGRLTRFHSRTAPGISVRDYLHRLAKHATLTPAVLLSMVYYIDRLCSLYTDFTINTLTVHRFLITAATVGAKGLSDSFWNNTTYARIGGVRVQELKTLELEFLTRVDWKIVPQPEILVAYYKGLVKRCPEYVLEDDPRPTDISQNPTVAASITGDSSEISEDNEVGDNDDNKDGRPELSRLQSEMATKCIASTENG